MDTCCPTLSSSIFIQQGQVTYSFDVRFVFLHCSPLNNPTSHNITLTIIWFKFEFDLANFLVKVLVMTLRIHWLTDSTTHKINTLFITEHEKQPTPQKGKKIH